MIFPNTITKNIITGIIAPHGITDLIHAKQEKLLPELYTINIFTTLGIFGIDKYHGLDILINTLFIVSSIYHFRHDMPKIDNIINKTCLSTLMLSYSIAVDYKLLLYFMCLFHVPNHYFMNKKVLNNNKKLSFLAISIITILSIIIGNTHFIQTHIADIIGKGLIISHIIYEETYIFNTFPKIIDFNK